MAGIAAATNRVGTVLWETRDWSHTVMAPSPQHLGNGKLFITAGYGVGSMMLQLTENNGEFTIAPIDEYKPKEGLACEQQTPVYWNGHLFGIVPKDGGTNRNQFICVNPSDTKKVIWASSKEARFG